jgi:hypothetical protein
MVEEIQTEEHKHKPSAQPIARRLVIKAIGELEQISAFIEDLRKIYPEHRMNFSPILRNNAAPGYHCFINLLMDATTNTKDIVRTLEPPEEPPLDKEV